MRIAIDISPVLYGTGVSVYTKNLVENLLNIDDKNEYILFGYSLRRKKELQEFVKTLDGNFNKKLYNIPPMLAHTVWNKVHIFEVEKLIGNIDIFHSSDWVEPPSKSKKVTTVHDLAPFKYPKLTHPTILTVHKKKLAWVRQESEKIIVPSKATKKDLIEMEFNENKIVVIPEAVSDMFKPASKKEIELTKKRHKISGDYLLAVGVNPRKNTENIIKAFEKVKAGRDLKLILVGSPTYMELPEARDIRNLGHVSQDELITLYSGASVFVYPSLYEGFGLPILEAMAVGTPVVTSKLSSMTEAAGDAAVLVDPESAEAIADGIEKAMKEKKELVKKGKENLKRFSWEKNARETLKVYESLAKLI